MLGHVGKPETTLLPSYLVPTEYYYDTLCLIAEPYFYNGPVHYISVKLEFIRRMFTNCQANRNYKNMVQPTYTSFPYEIMQFSRSWHGTNPTPEA